MLCEIANAWSFTPFGNFAATWAVLTLLGGVSICFMSGIVFWRYYWAPTFEQWQWKLNAEYPRPEKVRREVRQMFKSLAAATLVPTATLWLAAQGRGQAYCGVGDGHYGLSAPAYLAAQFAVFWVVSDLYEWAYHQVGHRFSFFWNVHRHHHVFSNPSPFSVISDEAVDQLVRTAPLILIPLAVPTNMDLLFVQYVIFFYAYGVYLHWGYESKYLSAHQSIINGSYEHWFHHAKSAGSTPYYTGFFFKLWDNLAGTVSTDKCVCSRCQVGEGLRSEKAWKKLKKPDYGKLLTVDFWLEAGDSAKGE